MKRTYKVRTAKKRGFRTLYYRGHDGKIDGSDRGYVKDWSV